ncbi:bifunctional hydroxymethylpyrimidine kinase/phosphomethylpyrimidine kinase [Mesorhizobium sp. M0207]|uniref:bifunctional hydroxymethylpyrimidine kinase/phosphomethylpyrimidine kinase n=1 Tax=Mesorhizobium sp. M0207 TaxID=2956915 RepID=UPI003334B07E
MDQRQQEEQCRWNPAFRTLILTDERALRQASHVLVVGGSDSSGGAGIARDIETLSSMGVRSYLAVTPVTVQTHDSVTDILHLQPRLVADQMRAAISRGVAA